MRTADSRYEVKDSPDYRRIRALPQRDIDPEECERLADELTPLLTTPRGKRNGVRLKPLQALALHEFYLCRGAHLGLPVGEGKTLICALAPYVVKAKRAVLIVPASLLDKTYAELAEYYRDWITPSPPPQVISYHDLQNDPGLLERIKPDLIMLDEADAARDQELSRAQRLGRYIGECKICSSVLQASKRGACKHLPMVITMTGTGTRFSINDFSHFLIWALKDNAPIPLDPKQRSKWASAIDELKPGRFGVQKRMRPGVLIDLAEARAKRAAKAKPTSKYAFTRGKGDAPVFGDSDVAIARAQFQLRLCRTPGVIIVDGTACDQPLTITHLVPPEDPDIDDMFERFHGLGETPSGEVLTDSLAEYRFENEAGCGGHYYFDPPPPEKWLAARKACFRFIRNTILESRSSACPLDTAKQVMRAYRKHPKVVAWRKVKPTFKPNSVWRWVSGSVVYAAAAMAKEHPGILIFARQRAVGEAIAEVAGLQYYGAQGKNANGLPIEKADPTKSAVLSFDANLRGRNLQGWNKMLILGCPQAATQLEQWLGREHRYGQKRPVHAYIMLTSGASEYAFEMAEREAGFVLATQKQTQKILRAKVRRLPGFPSDSARWVKKTLADFAA